MKKPGRSKNLRVALISVTAVIATGGILWLDGQTNLWQERVILSSLAASLVTFFATYLITHLFMQRRLERRWAPLNNLALTDILHSLADVERSEFVQGKIVPRLFSVPQEPGLSETDSSEQVSQVLNQLMSDLLSERRDSAEKLAEWAQLLAASEDNEQIMLHVAKVSLQLEAVHDVIVETHRAYDQSAGVGESWKLLSDEIFDYNTAVADLVREIQRRIEEGKSVSASAY